MGLQCSVLGKVAEDPEEIHLNRRGDADEEAPCLRGQAGGYADYHEEYYAIRFYGLSGQPVAHGQIRRRTRRLKWYLDQQYADIIRRQPVPAIEMLSHENPHLQWD